MSSGCGVGNGPGGPVANDPVISTPKTSGSLVLTTSTTQANYRHGIAIPITFNVRNAGAQPIHTEFGSCYDFTITIKKGAQEVWTGPSGGCAGVIRPLDIAPGAVQTYTYTWDQNDAEGKAIPTGTYTLTVRFNAGPINGVFLGGSSSDAYFSSNPINLTLTP